MYCFCVGMAICDYLCFIKRVEMLDQKVILLKSTESWNPLLANYLLTSSIKSAVVVKVYNKYINSNTLVNFSICFVLYTLRKTKYIISNVAEVTENCLFNMADDVNEDCIQPAKFMEFSRAAKSSFKCCIFSIVIEYIADFICQ